MKRRDEKKPQQPKQPEVKPLKLNLDTLRALDEQELEKVVGAGRRDTEP